jgi:glycosyltransferase involved in cell wall biosynthesis
MQARQNNRTAETSLAMNEFSPGGEPLVSIGLPVFNGESTLSNVIKTLLDQSYRNLEIVISDNCSTDGTQAICEDFAKLDPRIIYVRQPVNRGAFANFRFVLNEAAGQYFTWAASDDLRSRDFVQENLRFLQDHPDYVASVSPVRFEDGDFSPARMGDASLDHETDEARFLAFFSGWHANGRYYSLFRREVLSASKVLLQPDYFGADWAVVLEAALKGKFHRCDTGFVVLGANGVSNSERLYDVCLKEPIEFAFPFWKLSRFVMAHSRGFSKATRSKLLSTMVHYNRLANKDRLKRWHDLNQRKMAEILACQDRRISSKGFAAHIKTDPLCLTLRPVLGAARRIYLRRFFGTA